jgi:DNA-binding NarL/FixJ family response regulator
MGLEKLSPREKQVLESMKKGLMGKQIAFELGLDRRTISTYKRRIYEKLNVKSEWELALYVSRFVDIIQKDSKYNNNGTQEIVLGPFM